MQEQIRDWGSSSIGSALGWRFRILQLLALHLGCPDSCAVCCRNKTSHVGLLEQMVVAIGRGLEDEVNGHRELVMCECIVMQRG